MQMGRPGVELLARKLPSHDAVLFQTCTQHCDLCFVIQTQKN